MSLALLDAPAQGAGVPQWHLWGDLYLADPWCLVAFPLGLAVLWWGRHRAARLVGRVAVLPPVRFPRSLAQRLAPLVLVAQIGALFAASVAFARPVRANELATVTSEGVDIVLAIDRSSSMQMDDLEPGATRLDVVKRVVGEFALRRMTDREGAADNCALLIFARYPELVCPFTLDVDALQGMLASVELVRYKAEDGTGVGRALAKAVAVLAESDAKSKVVVLLTDGENNLDDITPTEAAELAAEERIKVHTVLAGRFQRDAFNRRIPLEIDSRELEAISRATGGEFFRAKDLQGLESVYAEIERMERTPRTEQRTTESFDLYARWLVATLLLFALVQVSNATWARRLL